MKKDLKLGIAGLGTVGAGLVHLLRAHGEALASKTGCDIVITAVSARDRTKDRGFDCSPFEWVDDPVELAKSPDIDVFVELIGGEEGPAKASVEAAIAAGKHVVTANKALLAHHGTALAKLAEEHDVCLNFEAAVAGGIPIVKTMRESLSGNEISRIYGILNGTCNYILTAMEREGRPFADILADAQEAGYAEADPTFDIGGIDAAHKLAILTSLAFGTEIAYDAIFTEGIEKITIEDIEAAGELGYRIKLLGIAMRTPTGIEQRVHPTMVPKDMAIADVGGVTNCVAVEGDFVGGITLVGPGAGGNATASSVMSDIADIARGLKTYPFSQPSSGLASYRRAMMRAHEGGYYVRLAAYDRPGAFAAIAHRMAEKEISLKSIMQHRTGESEGSAPDGSAPAGPVPIIMLTHDTTEERIREALQAIEADGHVSGAAQMIRIEKL